MNEQEQLDKLYKICSLNLKNSPHIVSYLRDRGISEAIIKKYNIGFFPQNTSKIFNYVNEDLLIRLGIVYPGNKSKFSEHYSLVFPVVDEYGHPTGLSGRTTLNDYERMLVDIPKYENSKYKKASVLYGLNHSRAKILKKNNVYVVEGYFDQISMDMNGVDNTVAICGTAFSNNHFIKLLRYTNCITFLLDNDDSGKKAMKNIFSKFSGKGANLQFKTLPNGYKDIDQFFHDGHNKSDFEKAIEDFIIDW